MATPSRSAVQTDGFEVALRSGSDIGLRHNRGSCDPGAPARNIPVLPLCAKRRPWGLARPRLVTPIRSACGAAIASSPVFAFFAAHLPVRIAEEISRETRAAAITPASRDNRSVKHALIQRNKLYNLCLKPRVSQQCVTLPLITLKLEVGAPVQVVTTCLLSTMSGHASWNLNMLCRSLTPPPSARSKKYGM